jgi:hypothetical protein
MTRTRSALISAGICLILFLLTRLPVTGAPPMQFFQPYVVNMALMVNQPTPKPSPTPTPIPPPIVNGDFEQGSKVGWSFSGGAYLGQVSGHAHSGTKYGAMGSRSATTEQITQIVTVPNDAPYLTYLDTTSSEQATCGYDEGFVWIQTTSDTARYKAATVNVFCGGKTYSAYRQHRLDLRLFKGQRVRLIFELDTNVNYGSYWNIDDVSFSS